LAEGNTRRLVKARGDWSTGVGERGTEAGWPAPMPAQLNRIQQLADPAAK